MPFLFCKQIQIITVTKLIIQFVMQYFNQEKRMNQLSNIAKTKLIQNKPNSHNMHREYEDQQNYLVLKGTDSNQVRDLKSKIKLVMTKLTSVKKQKDELHKQNKVLQQEVTTLQTNLRQMVSGFSNTSSSFPTYNEIGSKFAEFYKYQCLDLFFDILCPELNMKGIITFYYLSFEIVQKIIQQYFTPCFSSIATTGCFESIQGPIMNVLRKAFQTKYTQILANITKNGKIQQSTLHLKQKVNIEQLSQDNEERIKQYLTKLIQLKLCCLISDPPFQVNIKQIGQKVQFNPLYHDPFDGFIKPKDECWIVLPSVKKTNEEKETVTKSLVLQVNYDQLN